MKILFVFTGGTIGSTNTGGVADVDPITTHLITEICRNDGDEIELAFPYNMLSENATTDTLSLITNFMLTVDYDSFDGVIVTHGSDTLAYTANLLFYALRFVNIPVVVTAANYVIGDIRSNAADNMRAAYTFIKSVHDGETDACGVFVSWRNAGSLPTIYAGDRLLEADGRTDSFSSWGEPFAVIENGEVCESAHSDDRFSLYRSPNSSLDFLRSKTLRIKNSVLLLHSYVGLSYENIYINEKVKAVVLKLYHSGTACMPNSDGGEPDSGSFMYLANMCKKHGADLYITPAKKGSYVYSSTLGFESTAAIPVYGKSEISVYCALLLAYALEGGEREAVLGQLF